MCVCEREWEAVARLHLVYGHTFVSMQCYRNEGVLKMVLEDVKKGHIFY